MCAMTEATPSVQVRPPARRSVSPAGHLLAGTAASSSANLVVAVVGWLGTPPVDGELFLAAVTVAFVVSVAVGVVLLRRPGLRWSGTGVLAGAVMALGLIRPVLTLLFGW
jgi:hypothetical protein